MQEKYITVSVVKKDVEEARAYFARVGADLISHFAALGSKCVELDVYKRQAQFPGMRRQRSRKKPVLCKAQPAPGVPCLLLCAGL